MPTSADERTSRALYALLDLSKALSSEVDVGSLLEVAAEKASPVVDASQTRITLAAERSDVNKLTNTGSLLTAPIVDSNGDPLGVIESSRKAGSPRFDAHDEELMLAIASHLAVAIERAHLTASFVEHERLAEGLKLASEIQMRMLPNVNAVAPLGDESPVEIHAYIRPAKIVGGDLYDFSINDGRLYFCIGDVSGKGIGSALIMALTKTLFRANVPYYADVAKLTEAVNVRLCEDTGPTMFVTAFCGYLDLHDGTLRFCNAGHDRPFVLHADGSVDVLQLKPGLALGVLPKFTYPVQQVSLEKGDAIFLYTDGVTEATNASEQLFTIDRLQETLERCAGQSALRVIATTTNEVDRFVERAPQADDIAMMCIRYRG